MNEKNEKESFVMYGSFLEAAEKALDYEGIGRFVLLLRDYALKGVDAHSENPIIDAFLTMAKPNIKAATERYKKSVKGGDGGWRGAEYGILGGRPRSGETKEEARERRRREFEQRQQEGKPSEPAKSPVETPTNPKNPLNDNENVNDNEKENENVNDYVKDNVNEEEKVKVNDDFFDSMIIKDDFEEDVEDNYTYGMNASSYMWRAALQEREREYKQMYEQEEEDTPW